MITPEQRKQISNYLRGEDISPLIFYGYSSPPWGTERPSIEDMIYRCLYLSYRYPSVNAVTREIETEKGKNRSVIDIWRHIRYYYPDISLLEVMRNMHKVKRLVGHYCFVIRRHVFNIEDNKSGYDMNWSNSEFGIDADLWKDL